MPAIVEIVCFRLNVPKKLMSPAIMTIYGCHAIGRVPVDTMSAMTGLAPAPVAAKAPRELNDVRASLPSCNRFVISVLYHLLS